MKFLIPTPGSGTNFTKSLWAYNCNLLGILFVLILDYVGQIRSQFCICHDSWRAVVTCAKEWLNPTIIIRITSICIFLKILMKINRLWNEPLAVSSVHSRAEACDTSSRLIQNYTTQYDTTRHSPDQTVHFRTAILSQLIWVPISYLMPHGAVIQPNLISILYLLLYIKSKGFDISINFKQLYFCFIYICMKTDP